jgi:hypothetical protein
VELVGQKGLLEAAVRRRMELVEMVVAVERL